jgi:hypothetical protein
MTAGSRNWWNEWLRLNGNELSWIAVIVVLVLLVVLFISPSPAKAQLASACLASTNSEILQTRLDVAQSGFSARQMEDNADLWCAHW